MKKIISLLYVLLPCFVLAQQDSLSSGVYPWKEPKDKDNKNISTVILFEGKVHDMEWIQMSGNMIMTSKTKINFAVPVNEEHLMIIKSGNIMLVIKDSTYSIGAGSVALLMPGETFSLQSEGSASCKFYVMKYKSKLPIDVVRGKTSSGSLVKNWNTIQFKPHDKGGIRNFFERSTAMCKRFEMHVTTLKQGIKSHDPHTHRAEEIILVTENKTEMQIADKFYKGNTGSIYYLGPNVSHAIQNDGIGTCTYFAFQFE